MDRGSGGVWVQVGLSHVKHQQEVPKTRWAIEIGVIEIEMPVAQSGGSSVREASLAREHASERVVQ